MSNLPTAARVRTIVERRIAGVGQAVYEARIARGLRQEDLAALVDRSRPAIANIETGAARPSLEVLTRIAVVLGVPVDSLL